MNRIVGWMMAAAAVWLAACGVVQAAAADPLPELRRRLAGKREVAVLFVGNSYSFGVPKTLQKLAARQGRRLRVEQVTHGGWTLERHAKNDETLRRIAARRWDVVVLQEQSRIPSLSAARRDPAMLEPLRRLADAARAQGAAPVLYQTWGYRDGDVRRGDDDFHRMTARVREGYRAAAAKAGGLGVIPVGDAWDREMRAGRGGRLFMSDGSHPSREGDVLTAGVFLEALFPAKR